MPRASGKVEVVMTAQEAGLVNAWLRVRAVGPQGMEKDLRKTGAAGAKAGKNIKDSMLSATSVMKRLRTDVLAMGGAFVGVHQAMAVIRNEFEAIKRLQTTSASTQVELGTLLEQAKLSIPPGSDIGPRDLSPFVFSDRMVATGVPASTLFPTIKQLQGGKADLSSSESLAIIQAAAEAFPAETPQNFKSIADGMQILFNAFKDSEPDLTPQIIAAGFLDSFTKSRAQDAGLFAKTVIPIIASERGKTKDPEDTFARLMAFPAVIGAGSEDPESRRTSTGTSTFFGIVRTEALIAELITAEQGVYAAWQSLIEAGRTRTAEVIRQTLVGAQDPALGKVPRVIPLAKPKLSAEKRVIAPLFGLLDPTGESRAVRLFAEVVSVIRDLSPSGAKELAARREATRGDPDTAAAELNRGIKSILTRSEFQDPKGAAQAISDAGGLDIRLRGGEHQFIIGLEESLRQLMAGDRAQIPLVLEQREIFENQMERLLNKEAFPGVIGSIIALVQKARGTFGPSEKELQTAKALELSIQLIDKVIEAQKRSAEKPLNINIVIEDENGIPQSARPNLPQ